MYSVMWSEHCSYKSSKVHLRTFGELPAETPVGKLLAGIGENAGVIDIGQGYAVTFKVESHNHPSYVEPYQGAATGVGRHRPRHPGHGCPADRGDGPAAVRAARRPRHRPGAARGGGRRRRLRQLPRAAEHRRRGGLRPPRTPGNPLVNALCVGVLRHEDLHLAKATGVGNKVILYGAATGGDGIGGAVDPGRRDVRGRPGRPKRPSVQVGDPFMEKLLIECTLELFAAKLITGIQDFGGGRDLLRDVGAGRGRRRRHARRPRRRAAARLHPESRRDLDERVAGTDDGDRRARRRRGVPGDLRASGTCRRP